MGRMPRWLFVWGWVLAAIVGGALAAASASDSPAPVKEATAVSARFTRNGDGTVTDNRTGLIWLQDASCADLPRTDRSGRAYGTTAIAAAADLADSICGLTDGSRAGDWRLPSRAELISLLDLRFSDPALPNGAGAQKWATDDPFSDVESTYYWSSTPLASDPLFVWCVDLADGVVFYAYEVNYYYLWPVRGGR